MAEGTGISGSWEVGGLAQLTTGGRVSTISAKEEGDIMECRVATRKRQGRELLSYFSHSSLHSPSFEPLLMPRQEQLCGC